MLIRVEKYAHHALSGGRACACVRVDGVAVAYGWNETYSHLAVLDAVRRFRRVRMASETAMRASLRPPLIGGLRAPEGIKQGREGRWTGLIGHLFGG